MTLSASGSGNKIRLHDVAQVEGSRQARFIKAAAHARRENKLLREQVRRTDRALAELDEATYAFFGIEYTEVVK